ncbi:CpsB/CapC family capsule biosynthesis tyrosine phosphatase [Olivibacter sp. CPCC 100613]|uniref:tyrosine-protein phosphatase n=1 Tax=Olivibacter sp. CPCC 100613 TaxID=3079931 RepID=UPI002FFC0E0F
MKIVYVERILVMFNLFRKSGYTNLEWVGADIHSHLLPGIDDGAADVTTSLLLLTKLLSLGLKEFILTPHIYDEVFPNTHQTIDRAHDRLYLEMEQTGLADVYTHSSAEYMLGEKFDSLLEQEDLRPFPSNYLLVEMPWLAEPFQLEQTIERIISKGYKPIMAHPERYNFYSSQMKKYHELKEMGCLLQLNLLSPTGYYGKQVAIVTHYLVKNNMYDFLGTDLHHIQQLSKITKYIKSGQAYKDLGHLTIKNTELL